MEEIKCFIFNVYFIKERKIPFSYTAKIKCNNNIFWTFWNLFSYHQDYDINYLLDITQTRHTRHKRKFPRSEKKLQLNFDTINIHGLDSHSRCCCRCWQTVVAHHLSNKSPIWYLKMVILIGRSLLAQGWLYLATMGCILKGKGSESGSLKNTIFRGNN